mmetsp:Transcript_27392/g.45154  ORF Transcript_27392/g.45154 Transcript_27392/m.45154 type:complete len:258 (-) Transcript_27392:636-1409(-)
MDVVLAVIRCINVVAIRGQVLEHVDLLHGLVGSQARLLQHLHRGVALAGLALRAGRGAPREARAPQDLEHQHQLVLKATVGVHEREHLIIHVPLPADLDVHGAMCAAVQAVVDCRYITLIEGALEHVAGDGTKERPLVDLLPPSQVGVGICHPRCAQQAIGVENIKRTVSDFWDLQVGKPALIHNMIFINRVQWAEPFILEDRRLPYVVAVKVCVDCVLPVRQGNHRVNQLHHLLKLNGESKVMGHDARIIMPGITP